MSFSGTVCSLRHSSRYLWTDMNVVSRNPAAATRRIKGWVSGNGWRSASYGPLEAVFLGQPAEPDDSHVLGIFAEEGIDATSETTETIHVGVHLIKFGNGVWFREWRGDCCREGRPDFFSFPLIPSTRYGGLANVDARTGLEANLPGWRAGWERLVVGRFLAMGCLGASVAVWIWFGSDCNYGRGVLSRLGRGKCQ